MRVLSFTQNEWITHIPDVSSAPNLETLEFSGCVNLIKIDESVGFLGKLRILDLISCQMLKTLPSLMLPSLESLTLSHCYCLESFPEILGKMENLTHLDLYYTSIKELPYSICNLTRLQELCLHSEKELSLPFFIRNPTQLQQVQLHYRGTECLPLPRSIFMFRELNKLEFWGCEFLLLSNQDEGVEQVNPVVSSSTTHLRLRNCSLSDEFLQIFLPRVSNVQLLDLTGSNFTILPACIKDCHFLRSLYLNYCNNLQEIGGIPPNIEYLNAVGCTSTSSSSRGMLLNKVSLCF